MSERNFSFEENMDIDEKTVEGIRASEEGESVKSVQGDKDEKNEEETTQSEHHQSEGTQSWAENVRTDITNQPTIIKKNTGWIVAFWIALILLGCVIVSLASTLSNNLSSLNELQVDYIDLKTENEKLVSENSTLRTDKANLQRKINEISTGLYDAIYSFDPGKSYSDFYASSDIVVIKKGQKKTIDIYLNHYDTLCEWEWTNGYICDSDYGDWNDDMTFPVYLTAKDVGTTVFTFSNTFNKETVSVLVVVVE